jgi:hypothetical protein
VRIAYDALTLDQASCVDVRPSRATVRRRRMDGPEFERHADGGAT